MIDPTFSLFTDTLVVLSVVFPSLATVVVALRVYARQKMAQGLHWDDWTSMISLALCWGLAVNVWVFSHIVGIDRVKEEPSVASLLTYKFLWINDKLFNAALGLVKISILLFYGRIFTIGNFRIAVWIMILIISMWTVANVIVSIFKTTPIDGIWTDPEHTYNINDTAFSMSVGALSLTFDVAVLVMPIFVISTLHLPFRRKVGVMMIFWLGALCCIAAAVRLHLLWKAGYTAIANRNMYAELTRAFYWAEMEPNCSVIAASLPMLRPLVFGDGKSERSWLGSWFTKLGSLLTPKTGQSNDNELFKHSSTSKGFPVQSTTSMTRLHSHDDLEMDRISAS